MNESPSQTNDDSPADAIKPWSRRRQEVGVILWASFLAACLATMLFFAFFDPIQLGDDEQPYALFANRMTGYAIGFFFFWVVTFVSSALTAYLIETLPNTNDKNNGAARSELEGRTL